MGDYFTVEEDLKQLHIQIPKALFYEDKYIKPSDKKPLSVQAKILYGFLLDRTKLSLSNQWYDDKNRVFIKCDQISMSEFLGVSEKTARGYKNELINFELLEEDKTGQGKSNLLYLKKVDVKMNKLSLYIDKFKDNVEEKRILERERILKYREKEKENKSINLKNTLNGSFYRSEKKLKKILNGKNYRSRTVKTTVQERENLPYSNTDSSDTDFKVVVDEENKINKIENLYVKLKVDKEVKPGMKKLIEKNIDNLDIEIWEQIFINVSENDIKKKYSYIKKILENLKEKNIKTIEKFENDNRLYNEQKSKRKYSKNKFDNFNGSLKNKDENYINEKIKASQDVKYGEKEDILEEDDNINKKVYEKAVEDKWNCGAPIKKIAIEYAIKYNLPYPKE
ncbi:replication initiator protein A [Clostridioides sp. ES-S-0108-01]|uniref:replication initiator protein A n=1 Tax=unclassified Clostridioides TaxID=2635829 RepID=UPI001D0CB238|nr:replication initiator protein A [Clostridioides sp. ES-S-0107-01]MCC0785083.1 replication initiator protein A [Clostridioides sp. ES-S-0108-01]UDN53050.1 replication initiator protein A [Clostridioides sp. ES-S-0107-01]